MPHLAGPGGYGGSSYINSVVLRDRDGTQANWLSAADGTMEFRFYYCQNWRGDVVALISAAGKQIEFVRYTSYGIPIGFPGADTDTDGDCDQADIDQIQSWIDTSSYDWRGDVDLDGDVDSSDKSDAQNWLQGKTHGWEVLGSEGNGLAAQGTLHMACGVQARNRHLDPGIGRWKARDSLGYVGGLSLYEALYTNPLIFADPFGTLPFPGAIPFIEKCDPDYSISSVVKCKGGTCLRIQIHVGEVKPRTSGKDTTVPTKNNIKLWHGYCIFGLPRPLKDCDLKGYITVRLQEKQSGGGWGPLTSTGRRILGVGTKQTVNYPGCMPGACGGTMVFKLPKWHAQASGLLSPLAVVNAPPNGSEGARVRVELDAVCGTSATAHFSADSGKVKLEAKLELVCKGC